ncbi:MAG TPA: nucleotidyltransferase family protein [Planctomycetaceae bacterium]|nr:nucleotidyltransferase family protein [Planctomycetaceae bacterium]
MPLQVPINRAEVAAFCQKWSVREFAVFGSAVRGNFRPDSDVDVMVTFSAEAHPSLFDLAEMRDELARLFGREVDLVTRRGVEASRNPIRRKSILSTAEVIHVA